MYRIILDYVREHARACVCLCVCAPCLSNIWDNGMNAAVVKFERQDKVFLTDSPPYLLEERFYLQANLRL